MKRTLLCALSLALFLNSAPGWAISSFDTESSRWSTSVTQSSVYLETFPELQWWQSFHDPNLNQWVARALADNLDLQVAQARVVEARKLARASLAAELPFVSAGVGVVRQRNSENLLTPDASQFQAAGPRLFAPGQTFTLYTAPVAASYELDAFLKNRLATRAALARAESAQWVAKSILTSVIADTVRSYIQVVLADAMLTRLDGLVRLTQEELELVESRNRKGLNTAGEVDQVRQALFSLEQQRPGLEAQRALARNQLHVLIGIAPQSASPEGFSTLVAMEDLSVLSAGVPSQLVLRRPDLLAAEADLKAAALDVRAARRAFFPTIILNGQANLASTSLSQWFDWDSMLASIGSQMAQTLFDGGRRRANLQRAKVRSEQAVLGYRLALLQAFQETEDALSRHQAQRVAREAIHRQLAEVSDQYRLKLSLYRQGLVPYQDTLPLARQQLTLAQQEDIARATLLLETVSLYRALGGGVSG
jgi:multidrug efflux system outer membrane protein